jgi:hypothetical protein
MMIQKLIMMMMVKISSWKTIDQDTRFIVVPPLLSEVRTSNMFQMPKQDYFFPD